MATEELSKILKEYAAFETIVRRQITDICAPHCSNCITRCCGPDYCRENIDSPFLATISSKSRLLKAFCPERGWLTPAGCALAAGRPPVCYQFNCDKIMDALPDDLTRYLTRVLSSLVPYIGMQALGNRHLVEIMDPVQLNKVKHERFNRRLDEASDALQVIRSYNRHGFLPASSLPILSKIMPPPARLPGYGTDRQTGFSSSCP
jgi:hypothetical protein